MLVLFSKFFTVTNFTALLSKDHWAAPMERFAIRDSRRVRVVPQHCRPGLGSNVDASLGECSASAFFWLSHLHRAIIISISNLTTGNRMNWEWAYIKHKCCHCGIKSIQVNSFLKLYKSIQLTTPYQQR